jgi:hypothetical protein
MAATSSQPFADLLEKSKFRPGAFDTSSQLSGVGEGLATTPLTSAAPGTIPQAPGQLGSLISSPDMQLLRDEKDPFVRMMLVNKLSTQGDEDKTINAIERLRKQQYEDRIKMRPLEFQELMARKALDAITSVGDIPRRVAAIRQMYGPETIRGFGLPVDALNQGPRARYFS